MTVLAKTGLVRTKTEFNFIAAVYRHTQYLSIPVYQVLNVNWSTFLKGILSTLQSHGWNNGIHGGCQLGSGDLDLLPLAMWPTGVSLATVWVSWLLMECPKGGFCYLPPTHPPLPVPPHPPSLLSILTAERDSKNYHEIQPSETEKVSYNKNQ